MSQQPIPFTERAAIRRAPKERDAAVIDADMEPPPPTWLIPLLSIFLAIISIVAAVFILSALLHADDVARAEKLESQPFEAGYAIPRKKGPIFSWRQIREMQQPWNNWPCVNQFCTVDSMVRIERGGWRTLQVANNTARAKRQAQEIDREKIFMLDSGWFSWTDGKEFFVHLNPPRPGYTAGTKVTACFTGRVTRNDSRVEDYAIGDVSQNRLDCVPAILSEVFPDPLPGPPLRGAVSEGLWSWACAISGLCGQNPLTEWIIYKEREGGDAE